MDIFVACASSSRCSSCSAFIALSLLTSKLRYETIQEITLPIFIIRHVCFCLLQKQPGLDRKIPVPVHEVGNLVVVGREIEVGHRLRPRYN